MGGGQRNSHNTCSEKKVSSNHTKDTGEPNLIPLSEKGTKPLTDKQVKQRRAQHKKGLFKSRINSHESFLDKIGWFGVENQD